jgi:hypothetical protein
MYGKSLKKRIGENGFAPTHKSICFWHYKTAGSRPKFGFNQAGL